MNVERLKFAWARGARIQNDYAARGYMGAGWKPTKSDDGWRTIGMPVVLDDTHYRIHPDDAHLEYGPLSSAMRSAGIHGIEGLTPLTADAYQVYQHITGGLHPTYYAEDCGAADPKEVGRMHALFIAELLADEGL